MPLAAIDLLTPRGRLNGAALWPGVLAADVNTKLDAFLEQGYEEAEPIAVALKDKFAKSWGEYRAFDEVYLELLPNPTTVATSDQGSGSMLLTQIEWMGEERDKAKAICDAMLADAAALVAEAVAPMTRMSANVPTRFGF